MPTTFINIMLAVHKQCRAYVLVQFNQRASKLFDVDSGPEALPTVGGANGQTDIKRV